MRHLSIDIETFSDVDLKKCGVHKYARSEQFALLLFAYAYDFGEVTVVDREQGDKIPEEVIRDLGDPNVIKHAYNAAFEITCLNWAGYKTPADQWRCTMLHGMYLGYPGGLSHLGAALGIPEDKRKLASGNALIRYFCLPCKPTKTNGGRTRNLWHHDKDKWNAFKEYCRRDVVTEMEDYRRLAAFPVPDEVQADWARDYEINARGLLIDETLVEGALKIDAAHKAEQMNKAIALTGLENPNSRPQMLKWLNDNTELDLESLTKESVARALSIADGTAAEVLRIRKALAKSSVSKYEALSRAMNRDGRVRGTLQFYGANRTGRWSGRIFQPQNLPRDVPAAIDTARHVVRTGNINALRVLYGDVSETLSQLIRTAVIAPKDSVLVVSDFSAIEARVLAWLAGEDWRLEVFCRGGDIYCASASSMFGVPVEKHGVNGHLRQKGKVAELALGYQGGSKALIDMGALKQGLTEEELPEIVTRWRTASPRICDYWHAVENAVLSVMQNGQPVGLPHGIIIAREGDLVYGYDYLTIQLPSGRKLCYPQPTIRENQFGRGALHFRAQMGAKWVMTSTYGGRIVENITQAVARDCLAVAIRRLADAGYKPIMHVHDEVVLEVPRTELHEDELDRVNALMCAPIPWAEGLPLAADGFTGEYYKKD